MRRVIVSIGVVLVGLIVVGVCLQVLLALRHNQPFYDVNYWGLPLGTYSMAIVLVLAGGIGLVRLAQLFRARRLGKPR